MRTSLRAAAASADHCGTARVDIAPPRRYGDGPDRILSHCMQLSDDRPSSMNLMIRIAAALALATFVASCGQGQQQGGPPAPAVTVATPVKRTVNDYDEYVGRFVAVNSVEIRARVSG